ncbi:hypothetical protein QQ045_030456 [Rhodiola kirilowii]
MLGNVGSVVSEEMNVVLVGNISEEEVRRAVFAQGPLKAPGLDGFPGIFYQKHWALIKDRIISFVRQFWEEGALDREMNKTLIVLIPKKNDAVRMEDWRPISLCNVAMKIITKILATRLQSILNQVISIYQSAFVKGRVISDNCIVAHEITHFLKNCKGDSNFFASIKLDLSKAYDRVEWCFLEAMMRKMGFADRWVSRVMSCVTSVSYVVKVNDSISKEFLPERGLRQGDPLSPYLFVLCTELLSANIKAGILAGQISGLKINRSAPIVTHLFFADDSIFLIRADSVEATNWRRILAEYGEVSGKRINLEKSEVCFSASTPAHVRMEIAGILGIHQVPGHSKYLGLPFAMGQKKTATCRCIVKKVWKRINDWSFKLLSAVGREVLIKSVIQALLLYMMAVYKIPKSCIQSMTKMISKFWWGKKEGLRGVSWVNQGILQKRKMEGGLGFRDLKVFNEALLMKLLWRIVKFPNLLMSRVLLAKYCPDGTLGSARLGTSPSHVWRGALNTLEVFKLGYWWDAEQETGRWKLSSNGCFTVK